MKSMLKFSLQLTKTVIDTVYTSIIERYENIISAGLAHFIGPITVYLL